MPCDEHIMMVTVSLLPRPMSAFEWAPFAEVTKPPQTPLAGLAEKPSRPDFNGHQTPTALNLLPHCNPTLFWRCTDWRMGAVAVG